ncbi:hypothetical protein N7474_007534 [Penicillium riverlandense]|uniref:uncharacterized protein n=1 Tax=Penicillium riverlandense TaxID=1903569 RepID=UPI002549BDC5|nr:uncharacterized protein N7474_007534 [Penicillium riverlandense]KAJ5815757.1 hypothetical protein N7474_007534 [Penicillium riverlandense]
MIDAASDFGGTWAEERLYPNLLSQNSYGLYEFSDLPLADVVPPEENHDGPQFIAGWKINHYLHAWVKKWDLRKHIRLNWKIARLESKEWKLEISITTSSPRLITVICDKLILATGLTSIPNLPATQTHGEFVEKTAPTIHAKQLGNWAREQLGYQPLPNTAGKPEQPDNSDPKLESVAIYGGAKSAFDVVHFFATLHHNSPDLHLKFTPKNPVQVHWIIRDGGTGPAWMAPSTSTLPNGDTVASDKAASTRLLSHLSPCCHEIPKRLSIERSQQGWRINLRMEGSWLARIFHGNPLGRGWIRSFWRSVDRNLEELARYSSDPKMNKLRPENRQVLMSGPLINRSLIVPSVVSCASSIGIANQPDLWDTIRLPQVHIHRSAITAISGTIEENAAGSTKDAIVHLADGTQIDPVDLVVHATGYKPIVPIAFEPPSFRLKLGLSSLISSETLEYDGHLSPERLFDPLDQITRNRVKLWQELDQRSEAIVRQTLAKTGCAMIDLAAPSWAGGHEYIPYRLFRQMVAPELVAEGDRSFAALGIVLTSTIAVVAEVQALWVASFMTKGLEWLDSVSRKEMNESISEDVVLGSLTGTSLAFVNEEPSKETQDPDQSEQTSTPAEVSFSASVHPSSVAVQPENQPRSNVIPESKGFEAHSQVSDPGLTFWSPENTYSQTRTTKTPGRYSAKDESAVAGLLALGTGMGDARMTGSDLGLSDFVASPATQETPHTTVTLSTFSGPRSSTLSPRKVGNTTDSKSTEALELLRHYRYEVAPWVRLLPLDARHRD